jgi:ankyrin repeat protein
MFDRYRKSFLWTIESETLLSCDWKAGNHILNLKTVFDQFKSMDQDIILEEQLKPALENCGNTMSDDEIKRQLRKMATPSDSKQQKGVTFEAFASLVATSSILEEWAATLPLSRILALCIRGQDSADMELHAVSNLTDVSIDAVAEDFAQQLKAVILGAVSKFKYALKTMDELSSDPIDSKHIKFYDMVSVRGNNVSDFHQALTERIGWPNLNFLEGMESEHKRGASFNELGSNDPIFPQAEYNRVISSAGGDAMGRKRTMPSIEKLMNSITVKDSDLMREEVISLILYTGPMYYAYNKDLRSTVNEHIFEYPTTIFVVASAIAKLTRTQQIPRGMRLYRGFGGDVEFPNSFYQPDCRSCKGITEFGFLSTTGERKIAIQYSGAGKGKPFPMIIEIAVGSIDRGANVSAFSQYPHELEYLWAPGSFMEPLGIPSLEVSEGSVVHVIRVRTICNLKTMTTDELLSSRKSMHLKAFDELIRNAQDKLKEMKGRVEERFHLDVSLNCDSEGNNVGTPICSADSLIRHIVEQCKEVMGIHSEIEPKEFVIDERFRDLASEMLEVTAMAQSKLLGWLEDKKRRICHDYGLPLKTCHRERLSFLSRALCEKGDVGRADRAKTLCIAKGLMPKLVDKTNDLQAQILVTAAADGRSEQEIRLLLAASANVNDRVEGSITPVFAAAQYGHAHTIKALFEARADLTIPNREGQLPVWIAARNGHLKCVKALIVAGADVESAEPEKSSAAWMAAQRGHEKILLFLLKNRADVNAADQTGHTPILTAAHAGNAKCVQCLIDFRAEMTPSTVFQSGVQPAAEQVITPLILAAQMGHAECIEIFVHLAGEKNAKQQLLEQRGNAGWSPLHFASNGGHTPCIRLLRKAGFDVMARANDGSTPVFTAAKNGQAGSIRALLEAKADIDAPNFDGQSPVWIAAQQGHAECVQVLLDARADPDAPDKAGRSPAWAAAERGHTIRAQGAVDGRDDGGTTLAGADSAAQGGHAECIKLLHAARADVGADTLGLASAQAAVAEGHAE